MRTLSIVCVLISAAGMGACGDSKKPTSQAPDAGGAAPEVPDAASADVKDAGVADSGADPRPDAAAPQHRCLPIAVGSGREALIDDFEDGDSTILNVDGRGGFSYTYAEATGSITATPVAGGAPGSTQGIRVAGSYTTQYSTGWGTTLNVREEVPCPFDASNYVGVSFWARSQLDPAPPIELVLAVAADHTCELAAGCFDYYSSGTIVIDSSWRRYELLWNGIAFAGPSAQPSASAPPTIHDLYSLDIKPLNAGAFDFSIDDLQFLTGGCGTGVCDPLRPCPSDCCGNRTCDSFEYGSGLAPGFVNGRYMLGPTYCAADCPLPPSTCPTLDLGSQVPQSVSGNTVLASDDFAGTCSGLNSSPVPDVEYTFTAPEAGSYLFVASGSNFSPTLYVLDAACSGSERACVAGGSNPSTFNQSAAALELSAGQVVTLVVEGQLGAAGPFLLDVSQLAGACVAEDLGNDLPVSVSGSTASALNTVVPRCGSLDSPDKTYLWTAPADGTYDFDTAGSSFDTVLELRAGACTGSTLSCVDDGASQQARVRANLSAGQAVSVTIDGRGAGDYTLSISEFVCPGLDLGDTLPFAQAGTTVGGRDDFSLQCGGGGSVPDASFAWTAPAAGAYIFDTVGSNFDTVLSVLDGATCSGLLLSCNDDTGALGAGASEVTVTLSEGQHVVIVVDGFSSSGDFVLNGRAAPPL